ncbi:sulfite exporter TauE/SafE family protein 3-like isoform X2 [Triticum urartu]|uniref:sulfite exporter TauE/SafE family protein 3-like isoform X2 n=1 Tax=Triticum urartu TaxID=4572 RepID=UPI00204477B9|nr:sulfite exporter TauE/SafE family protein 3-like isoform X2 [Triticum urartu]
MGRKWHAVAALGMAYAVAAAVADGDKGLSFAGTIAGPEEASSPRKLASLYGTTYHHVWPPMKFGWRIVLGSFIGFFGAAFGSVGGVGGGGIFVPMLTLIIGFDPKSSAAMSKCMITGAAVSTVYCNLKLKHPTLDMPMIDYDLALLIQPMLMMGVSIGVICNVIFPDWLVTVLLIILFLVTSVKAFLKGVEAWKKETEAKAKQLEQSNEDTRYTPPPTGPNPASDTKKPTDEAVSIWKNIYWKEFGLLASVWVAFLTLQVTKNYVATCSTWYWVLTVLQIPVSVGVSMYQAAGLVQGKRALSSRANNQTSPKAHQILVYCLFGVTAGVLAGLLGVGGGVVMGPLFLELGIHPQVSSATGSFAMMFSSSMAAVEYYLLKRFPVPYALFFTSLTFVAAIVGQRVARKLVNWLGRASFIIFILSSMIFVSAISLGGVGISKTTHKMARHEYMGFGNICNYHA